MLTPRTRRARLLSLSVVATLTVAACSPGTPGRDLPESQGPPLVQTDVVAEHAKQFDEVLADRPAGSQKEFAAATYILGHLQTAGYVPLLDPVPVEDSVRSTNVVAEPPSGVPPDVVVAIAYDTRGEPAQSGTALGLWLELARALYARDRRHAVEFVALGAESTDLHEGNLGSRRLVEFLRGDDLSPLVVVVDGISPKGDGFAAVGADSDELGEVARRFGVLVAPPPRIGETDAVLVRAGFRQVSIGGSVSGVGRVLLEFLSFGEGATPSPS